jgi:hypothetical protein
LSYSFALVALTTLKRIGEIAVSSRRCSMPSAESSVAETAIVTAWLKLIAVKVMKACALPPTVAPGVSRA